MREIFRINLIPILHVASSPSILSLCILSCLNKSFSANKLIGVQEINSYLKNDIDLKQCKELINIKTRQYAKRQNTWARGHMKNWNKVYSKDFSHLLKKTLKVIS